MGIENVGGNQLFPIFLRMDKLNLLVVGAGEVGWEKLGFMFKHCQEVKHIRVVAPEIREEIVDLSKRYDSIFDIRQKEFEESDLEGVDIVIAATCFVELNKEVHRLCKEQGKIVNVADTPGLCDFYLASVVKKGDLKVAISSNGKSPTLTKRMRELLTDALPEEVDDLLQNLAQIRDSLKLDFEDKVGALNNITSNFNERSKDPKEYQLDDLTILWDSEKCIHCGKCSKGLPNVFNPKVRPWVQVSSGNKQDVVEQVKDCPSGALSIKY